MRNLLVAVVAVLTLAGLTAHHADAAPAQQIRAVHVVQPGETVFCIARGYRVNPWSIAAQNGLMNPNFVVPGQHLAIPIGPYWFVPGPTCAPGVHPPVPPHPGPGCTATHTVMPGDTLYRIALMHGSSVWAIANANGIANPNYIRVGQTLCIPGGHPAPWPPHPWPVHPVHPGP
jgi:putative chitinase